MSTRIVVIGGGIGGYSAAIRAARLGAKVTLIEKHELGGTCLHRGCIPTKAFLHSAEIYDQVVKASKYGVNVESLSFDMGAVARRKNQIVQRLAMGVRSLVLNKKIDLVSDEAKLLSPRQVLLVHNKVTLDADKIIIATGSFPASLPPGIASPQDVINSDQVLAIDELPGEVLVIGGGVVGIEFAQFFSKVGIKVTVIEMLPRILPGMDEEVVKTFLGAWQRERRVEVISGAKVIRALSQGAEKEVTYIDSSGQEHQKSADQVVVSIGRVPQTGELGLEAMGIAFDNRGIKVNSHMETSTPGVYAAGDVTGGWMLAHTAAAGGECAAKNAMGLETEMLDNAVPRCVYSSPEMAAVGLTEQEASAKFEIKTGKFPLMANGKALVMGQQSGMVKIIAEKKRGTILGAHILGPHATDLISELVLAMGMEATVEEIARSIHPHPSLSEAVMEAAMEASEGAIHLP